MCASSDLSSDDGEIVPTGASPKSEFPPRSVCLVLFDLERTLVAEKEDRLEVQMRPHAAELIARMLQMQSEGACQVGFYTPTPYDSALHVAAHVLSRSTGFGWQIDDHRRPELLGAVSGSGSQECVWLFDELHMELDPSARHSASGTPMHMKSLMKIWSACEKFSPHQFSDACTVFVSSSADSVHDGAENTVAVTPYEGELLSAGVNELELDHLRRYLEGLLCNAPDQVRVYLDRFSFQCFKEEE